MFLFFLGQMNHLPQKLRMRMSKEPVHIVCPHCQHNGMSYIEKKVGGIIICYGLMLALIWYAVFFSKLTSETIKKKPLFLFKYLYMSKIMYIPRFNSGQSKILLISAFLNIVSFQIKFNFDFSAVKSNLDKFQPS